MLRLGLRMGSRLVGMGLGLGPILGLATLWLLQPVVGLRLFGSNDLSVEIWKELAGRARRATRLAFLFCDQDIIDEARGAYVCSYGNQ